MPEDTQLPPKKYWAFISYSSLDRKWGQWLHRRLENYPIPREFRGTEIFDGAVLGKNLRPVFRDRDELAGSSNLGPAILKGLQDSRFLIVLCSQNSAKSKWVNKEIEDFIAVSGDENILALILSGEPNASSETSPFQSDLECFPPALRYPIEPLAGDLRKEGDGKQRGFLKILAGISQLDFDVLYRRHERAQRNRRIIWSSIAALIIAALTGLSIFSVKKTREQSALLDNVALADHDSALQAFDLGQYRESAAYYARSLSIRPRNNTIALSAVSSALMADTLFAKQRHIFEPDGPANSLFLDPSGQNLLIETASGPQTYSLIDGRNAEPFAKKDAIPLHSVYLEPLLATHPWLSTSAPSLSTATLSPDGTVLFAGSSDGNLHKFDLNSHRDHWATFPKQRKNNITNIAVSPCGQTLAVADWDSSLSLIEAQTGELLDTIIFAQNINHLAYTPDGFFLIASSENGTLRIFNTGSSPALIKTTRKEATTPPEKFEIKFSHRNGYLYIEDLGDGSTFKDPPPLAFSPDILRRSRSGNRIAAGDDDGRFSILRSNPPINLRRHGKITDIAFSEAAPIFFVASQDRNLIAYDITTGTELWRQPFKGFVNQISLSADDQFIAAASDDFTFRIFDTTTGKTVWTTLTDDCVEHIRFSTEQPTHLTASTKGHHFQLDATHLFQDLTDRRGELASHFVKHAATQVHELVPPRGRRSHEAVHNVEAVLAWKTAHPVQRTRSPFSPDLISTLVSEGLIHGPLSDADQLHRLAPWHPLTPASLSRLPRYAEREEQRRFLCELTLSRLRSADPDLWNLDRLTQDCTLASRWFTEMGFPDLADETAALAKSLRTGNE